MATQRLKVVVVGSGIMGSAATFELAKAGAQVTLLEQFDFGHKRGSSHGESRIIRRMYPERHYAEAMSEAFVAWKQLEDEAGTRLYTKTGGLDIGLEGSTNIMNVEDAARAYDVPFSKLSASEVTDRFNVSLPKGYIGLFQPDSGVLNASKCVATYQALARVHGATLRDNETLVAVDYTSDPDRVVVRTSKSTITCDRLVLTPGAWAAPLLKLVDIDLSSVLNVQNTAVAYFQTKDKAKSGQYDAARGMPVLINYGASTEKDHHCYALPGIEYPGLFKVAVHGGPTVTADTRAWKMPTEPYETGLKPFVETFLPDLDPVPVHSETCLYTNSPDDDFVIDLHLATPNIVIGTCGSGHAFKLGPVIGRTLADLALKGATHRPRDHLRLDRPTLKPPSSKL